MHPRQDPDERLRALADEAGAREAIGWVTMAVQARRTTVPRLRGALQRRARLRHRRLLVDLLSDVAQGAETPLELAYLRDVDVYGEPCPVAFQVAAVLVRRGWDGLPHRCPSCLGLPLELIG